MPSKVYIHRSTKGPEEVAEFIYSDLAEVSARAICERFHYPVSVHTVAPNGEFNHRFEHLTKEVPAVVEVPYQPVG